VIRRSHEGEKVKEKNEKKESNKKGKEKEIFN
jgi:hypothetical protein